ncbi:MAG: HTTM domain-containing protein [Vicinamibacterales bacterium]
MTRALVRLLTHERPAWPLAVCRIGLGTAAMIRGLKTVRDLYLLQHDPAAVPARLFEWAPRLAATWEIACFGLLWMAASLGLVVGYRARLSAGVLLALSILQHLVDQNFWAHHMYFMMLMLLLVGLSDSEATLSVRWGRESSPGRWIPGWPVWLLKVQLSLAYFYSAAAKLNEPFLSGQVLLDRLALPDFARDPVIIQTLAVGAVGVEFFLAFALWNRRLRPLALVAGLFLHGLIPVTMGLYAGLIVFSMMVFSIYVLFLDDRTR